MILTSTPVGAQETRNTLSGINVNTSKVFCGKSDHEEIIPDKYVDILIGVFFDGTMNNRKNTQSRVAHEKKERGETLTTEEEEAEKNFISADDKDTSYYNDESNVSRSEPYYDKEPEEKLIKASVYIDGIGTDEYEGDSPKIGGGLGMGPTGVIAKVLKGCKEAVEEINKNIKGKKINRIHIDTFGFSRGAAAARNFVHEVTKKKGAVKQVIAAGQGQAVIIYYEVDYGALGEHFGESFLEEVRLPLCIRFVGLYDTVASYGVKHSNDTRDLHLNAISKAHNILQLAAADEHRVNFRLTNINSAGSRGTEKFLPGVHSDIGGSYVDGADEEVIVDQNYVGWGGLETERQKLIEAGWYQPSEIKVHWRSLIGTRTNISNKYSYIPLQIMAEYAETKKVLFLVGDIKAKYTIEEDPKSKIEQFMGEMQDYLGVPKVKLADVKTRIDAYIKGDKGRITFDNEEDKKMLRSLRNYYFHFSSHYKNTAGVMEPMQPNMVDGERVRVVQNG